MTWKFTDNTRKVAFRVSGAIVESAEAAGLLAAGEVIADPDPPPPLTAEEQDLLATKTDAAIQALQNMSLAEIKARVDTLFPQLTAQQRQFLYICGATCKWVANRL